MRAHRGNRLFRDRLRRPALGPVHRAQRPVLGHEENLVRPHRENLPGHILRGIAREIDRYRRDLRGLHALHLLHARLLVRRFRGNGADHAAPRERRDAIRGHLVFGHVQRHRLGQRGDAELRRGVIGLAEIADQARGRGHVDVTAGILALEIGRRGARDVERAVQMHVDHRLPFLDRHVEEEAVAQDAGVIHDHVDPAEGINRGLDDAVGGLPLGHAVGVRHRRAAFGLDFLDHFLCRPGVLAFARDRGADVVDDHLGAPCRHGQREIAPDAAAGACHNDDFVFQHRLTP